MQKPMICNRIIMERFNKEQNLYLRTKLNEAKTGINNSVPESFNFYSIHFNGFQKSEHPCNKIFILIKNLIFFFIFYI